MSENQENATVSEDWIMQTKDTPYWKFILGANLFKKYQLDCIEKKGDVITARVRSGKEVSGKVDELECSITKKDARDFTVKNTTNKEKITFRETLFQMDEEWWDDLEKKIGAEESKTSKALGVLSDIAG